MDVSPWLLVGVSAVLCVPPALELRQMTRGGVLASSGLYLLLFCVSCMLIDRFLVPIPVAALGPPPPPADRFAVRLSKDPVCKALKDHDPQRYRELVAAMVSSDLDSMAQAYASFEVNGILSRSLRDHLPHASDTALVHYMQAMLRELQDTAWEQQDACLTMGIAPGAEANRPHFLKGETRALYTGVFIEVLESASHGGHPAPSRAAFDRAVAPVMEELRGTYGRDLRLLADPGRYVMDEEDRATYCRLVTSYYEAVAFQPSEEAGAILRWLYAPPAVPENAP
ncbi:hypothetical protein [Desulfoluna butyratoxydans]|uniref:Uncharacterized protein n=1 Tax=Desulfoluna butyratoxydans TaxID=231438 RepID=A0A4U8YX75_9BACT|nr:hypothetical protein [Desulfoluna butyratoxydans]VFQ46043.1 hypothetical protein MSL71_37060 [Desulfoluna butyratoxydans]